MRLSGRIVAGALVSLSLLGYAGCRIDHYALVRVSVRDVDTGELFTNGTCSVACSFACYSFWRALGWESQRCETQEKAVRPEDGGVKWFWGHGDSDKAWASIRDLPVGYYNTHSNSADGCVGFDSLMTFIPIPLHMPPFRNATVYVRRQFDPIDAEVHHIVELCGPKSNGVFLASYIPGSWGSPTLTSDYEFTAGYDCMKGDYCPPFGKGDTADILFVHSYVYKGVSTNRCGGVNHNYVRKRTMRFTGKGNGFIFRKMPTIWNRDGHEFTKDDFLAPRDGYQQEDECSFGEKDSTSDRMDACFDFRIRSRYDEDGNLKSCHYGRFNGRYSYYLGLYAKFYVNPTPLDRNLELINGKQSGSNIWRWR